VGWGFATLAAFKGCLDLSERVFSLDAAHNQRPGLGSLHFCSAFDTPSLSAAWFISAPAAICLFTRGQHPGRGGRCGHAGPVHAVHMEGM